MPDDTRRVIPEIVIPGRRLGRNVNHDSRSMLFRVHAQPARALVSVTHERRVPVFDQGDLGSCTGNAAVGAVGTAPLFDGLPGTHPNLDEPLAVKVYSAATVLDDAPGTYPPTDTGSDGLSAAKACKNLGLISGYLHATDVTTMQTALQDTPVIVGVNWYEGFDNPDHNGLVSISGQVRGGHEFEVVGLDLEKKLFLAVNSWGTGWGVNGHFSFSFDTMAQLLSRAGRLHPAPATHRARAGASTRRQRPRRLVGRHQGLGRRSARIPQHHPSCPSRQEVSREQGFDLRLSPPRCLLG